VRTHNYPSRSRVEMTHSYVWHDSFIRVW